MFEVNTTKSNAARVAESQKTEQAHDGKKLRPFIAADFRPKSDMQ
jgi:hypothetical protein